MTDDRKAGLALILGTVGSIITMAIHPHGSVTPTEFEHMALVSAVAHSLAMVSFIVLFLGTIQLTLRLASHEDPERRDRLAVAGLVTFGFAATALLIATAVSGFIVPGIMRHVFAVKAANEPQWDMIISAVFQFNQAFASVYSVAASSAIGLWSASALRNGGLRRFIALYGCTLPLALIILIAVGHIRLNVHGMAVVVLVHSIWFVIVGVGLYRQNGKGEAREL
jgi:hypothetical protein